MYVLLSDGSSQVCSLRLLGDVWGRTIFYLLVAKVCEVNCLDNLYILESWLPLLMQSICKSLHLACLVNENDYTITISPHILQQNCSKVPSILRYNIVYFLEAMNIICLSTSVVCAFLLYPFISNRERVCFCWSNSVLSRSGTVCWPLYPFLIPYGI